MKKFKKMSDKEFLMIKGLLAVDVPSSKIMQVTNRSWNVLSWVRQSKTFAEYRQNVRSYYDQYRAKKATAVKTNGVAHPEGSTIPNIVEVLLQIKASNERMESEIREIKEMVKKEVNKNVFHFPDINRQ